MRAVMYHYVRTPDPALPHLRHLHTDDFVLQVDHLDRTEGLARAEDVLAWLDGGGPLPSGAVLTFDDGLVDHHDTVAPILAERDAWGVFYVPTGPYRSGTILDVHRIHLLLGRLGGADLLARLRAAAASEGVDLAADDRWAGRYVHQDDRPAAEAKRILNYEVRDDDRARLLDRLEADLEAEGVADRPTVDDVYVRPDQLRAMQDAGLTIGSHAVTHRVLARLSPDEQRAEIDDSFALLDEATGGLPWRTFCFPYGGADTYTDVTEDLLDAAGSRFGFSVDPRPVADDDRTHRRQSLPRFDCNRLPHGAARGA